MKNNYEIQNLNEYKVIEDINKFKNDKSLTFLQISEIINYLLKTLKCDCKGGRQKFYSISIHRLAEILGVNKGIISKYIKIFNISEEVKFVLKNYNISSENLYKLSKIKGNNQENTIRLQKEEIYNKYEKHKKKFVNVSSEEKNKYLRIKNISYNHTNIVPMIKKYNFDDIVNEFRDLFQKIKRIPTKKELCVYNKFGLLKIIEKYNNYSEICKILGYDYIDNYDKYYENIKNLITDLKPICNELGRFPLFGELHDLGRDKMIRSIERHGGIIKIIKIMNYSLSDFDKLFYEYEIFLSEKMSYIGKRGKNSEKIVKEIIKQWCINHNKSEPQYNIRLSKGRIIEFICENDNKIGIDVTNTENKGSIIRKWTKKKYQEYLDELWIVVFSDSFTENDFYNFNMKSPENVKIFHIYDFLKEIKFSVSQKQKEEIDKYCECSFHTKQEIKNKYNHN